MDVKGAQALKKRLEATSPAETTFGPFLGSVAASALPIYRWLSAVPPHRVGRSAPGKPNLG